MLKLGGLSCLFQVRSLKKVAPSTLVPFHRNHDRKRVTTSLNGDAGLPYLMRESKFNHIKVGNFVDTETHMT